MENMICVDLIRQNIKVFYHTFSKGSNQYKLNLVYQKELITHVIEVKSCKNKNHSSSLNQIKDNQDIKVITTSLDKEISDTHIPLYMFYLSLR